MCNPKISVIVPVYNVEKYLPRCIDSILAQTFTDFELLLIDDGSSDNSGRICDKYAMNDKRIRAFHQENGGVSYARNMGLDKSKGEYVFFIDSDDYVESDCLASLYACMQNQSADIVFCDFIIEKSQTTYRYIKQSCSNDKIEIIKKLLCNELGGYLWNKLVRKEIFINNGINFPNGIGIWEDLLVSVNLYYHSKNIAYMPCSLYHYVQYNTSSAMNTFNKKKVDEKIKVCELLKQLLIKFNLQTKCLSELYRRQLIAKMEYATDYKFYDFNKWNDIFPDAYNEMKNLSYPLWMKLQMCLVRNRIYPIAYLILIMKRILNK